MFNIKGWPQTIEDALTFIRQYDPRNYHKYYYDMDDYFEYCEMFEADRWSMIVYLQAWQQKLNDWHRNEPKVIDNTFTLIEVIEELDKNLGHFRIGMVCMAKHSDTDYELWWMDQKRVTHTLEVTSIEVACQTFNYFLSEWSLDVRANPCNRQAVKA